MDHDLDQINAVPLIDVMLVLLAIVLTTATFISAGQIPVDLAEAKNAAIPQTTLTITIQANGELYLDQDRLSLDELVTALSHYSKQTSLVIRADRTIALERFVTVVDTVKGLGFDQISLQVERRSI
jgi:biopolymer transport protein ExbD